MDEDGVDRRISVFRAGEWNSDLKGVYKVEYEVEAETSFVGIGRFKGAVISRWLVNETRPGERTVLHLEFPARASGNPEEGFPDVMQEARLGYHSGIDATEEFVALASVALRRRLRLGAITKLDGRPYRREAARRVYPELLSPNCSLSEIGGFLSTVEQLQPSDQAAVLLASKFYHHGLQLTDQDAELAYLMHIFAVESLAQRIKQSQDPDLVLPQPWLTALNEIPDESLRNEFKRELARHTRATKAFIDFIADYTDDDFFLAGDVEHWITRSNLRHLAGNVYTVRSRLVHEGLPFPADVIWTTADREEIDYGHLVLRGDPPEGTAS